jgi:hypothetical protein
LQFLNLTANQEEFRRLANEKNSLDQNLWIHAKHLFCKVLADFKHTVITGDVRVIKELAESKACPKLVAADNNAFIDTRKV